MADYFVVKALARIWEDSGFRVEVGPSYCARADVCILHHDLTTLDPAALPEPPPGAPVVNGRVLDISKRSYSTLQLRPGSSWPGSVIVKTNCNYFGEPESELAPKRSLAVRLRKKLARVSWRLAQALPPRFYPILESVRDVPDWVWSDPDLIVERFLPEREGEYYAIRGWVFLGDRSYGYRLFATDPLVKVGRMAKHEYLERAPDEIMAYRDKLGFDFGKFDYVEHDGEAILLDANKTPSYSGTGDSPRLRMLAEGIRAYIS